MSMDILELNIELAKEFGVELETDFWRQAETFGAVVDEVARHLGVKGEESTVDAGETLPKLIEAVIEITGTKKIPNGETTLSSLVPIWRRHQFWRRLRERFPLLPTIASGINDRTFRILGFEPIPFFLGVIGIAAANSVENPMLKYAFAAIGIVGFLGFVVIFPLLILTLFALPCKRLREAAKVIEERRRRWEAVYRGDLTDIETKLRGIFCRVLAVEPENVTRDAPLSGELELC